jgi:hypothetical protein
LLIPELVVALVMWEHLRLELGETAIVIGDGSLAPLLCQGAIWHGGAPVIHLGDAPIAHSIPGVESLLVEDTDQVLVRLRRIVQPKAGFAAVDISGSPQMLTLLFDLVPVRGRLYLGDPETKPVTIDFYNNVHRKGIQILSSVIDPISLLTSESYARYSSQITRAIRLLSCAKWNDAIHRLVNSPS